MRIMKITKDEYIKQCWTYVNTTLKYLKDLTDNIISVDARKEEFKKISDQLLNMSSLEGIEELKEGSFYNVLGYRKEEVLIGKFLGTFSEDGTFKFRFDVLCASETRIWYNDVTNVFDINITNITNNSLKFEPVTIKDEDLPLYVGKAFSGALLEKLMKGQKKGKDNGSN
jgi:hypothetical protein